MEFFFCYRLNDYFNPWNWIYILLDNVRKVVGATCPENIEQTAINELWNMPKMNRTM